VATQATGLPAGPCYLRVADPSAAFERVVARFAPPQPAFVPGVHPRAVVAAEVGLDPAAVSVGPGAVVSRGCVLGAGTVVGANVWLGENVQIGRDCVIHANVSIRENCRLGDRVILHCNSVVGADGFGFEMTPQGHRKIDQVGIVQIDDDVEIGAGTTIDRARFGRTWIGAGTKIDNQVMIGHNCVIGKHCIIVAQCGLSGSSILGDHVTLAAKVGVAGHVRIASGVVVMGASGVTKDLAEPGYYLGFPAAPVQEARRVMAAQRSLPGLLARVKKLETSGGPPA
jgi:UDP-3-O-[3-hydroxymyristoyl] glucosamine N-acyltransferase